MAGSIKIDTKEERLENTYDGKIFQKIEGIWKKFQYTMFRGVEEPTEATIGDIWLNDNDNILYNYTENGWENIGRNLFFTEEPIIDDTGNNLDYNVLSGIIQVGPIVKFGDATQDNLEKPYTYTNKTDKRLHVVNELGDYKVNFDNELPARTNSLANALIIDTNLYPNLPLRKSINA